MEQAVVLLAFVAVAGVLGALGICAWLALRLSVRLLGAIETSVNRIVAHLDNHQILGGKPKDMIEREMDLEHERLRLESQKEQLILREQIRQQQDVLNRDPFSGVPFGRDERES